jgi:hypothetical protein
MRVSSSVLKVSPEEASRIYDISLFLERDHPRKIIMW